MFAFILFVICFPLAVGGGPLLENQEYELSEFRFHWGREDARGSEHTVNFKAFPMEVRLRQTTTT